MTTYTQYSDSKSGLQKSFRTTYKSIHQVPPRSERAAPDFSYSIIVAQYTSPDLAVQRSEISESLIWDKKVGPPSHTLPRALQSLSSKETSWLLYLFRPMQNHNNKHESSSDCLRRPRDICDRDDLYIFSLGRYLPLAGFDH
jgi:hypothetical protein